MTITDNAAKFATRAEIRVDMERHSAVRDALHTLREYHDIPHTVAVLLDSVHKQARWSGDRPVPRGFVATFTRGDVR